MPKYHLYDTFTVAYTVEADSIDDAFAIAAGLTVDPADGDYEDTVLHAIGDDGEVDLEPRHRKRHNGLRY